MIRLLLEVRKNLLIQLVYPNSKPEVLFAK